jgi:hypothetical protein
MIRRLFTVIIIISSLLFAMTIGAWSRSYFSAIIFQKYRGQPNHGGTEYMVRLIGGRFTMCGLESVPFSGGFGCPYGKSMDTNLTYTDTTFGFGLAHSNFSDPNAATQFAIEFPIWSLASVFILLPLVWLANRCRKTLFRLVDRYRIPAGCCRHCGYDLTGNTSGVCPECGTPVRQRAEAHA